MCPLYRARQHLCCQLLLLHCTRHSMQCQRHTSTGCCQPHQLRVAHYGHQLQQQLLRLQVGQWLNTLHPGGPRGHGSSIGLTQCYHQMHARQPASDSSQQMLEPLKATEYSSGRSDCTTATLGCYCVSSKYMRGRQLLIAANSCLRPCKATDGQVAL